MKLIPPTAVEDVVSSITGAAGTMISTRWSPTVEENILDTQRALGFIATTAKRDVEAIAVLAAAGESFITTLTESMSRMEDSPDGYPAVLALTAILRGAEVAVANLTQLTFDGQSAQGETIHETGDGHTRSSRTASAGVRKTRGRRRSASADHTTTRGQRGSARTAARKPTPAEHRANLRAAAGQAPGRARTSGRTGGRKGTAKKGGKRR